MRVDEILDAIYPLSDASRSKITDCITEVRHPKGHLLLRADKIESSIYFIKKGIVRAYAQKADNEITFWFGREGDTVISMRSYVQDQRGYEDIELLEDCDLYELKTEHLRALFNADIHITNWGRRFAEQELIKVEERLIAQQFRTASERYRELLESHPELIQRVPLGHIASYLGITQVSLSRIRAEVR
ncbi:Crp/Fnr family transcriptional regulator [Rufibacter immobilis]|uniref:Crp/Fnr family transcriptional regulator n=1 Tax=Rufibacter immobilis TaxID=1348778 RepID=A0A3M9N2E3_9BACT|nr:Crp/Fnr family transcriptional regulator [Rufibacter immobilis]RNI31972.1 Crp/Fnr family transcriptional regulator [Rufibacter immobilis]